MCLVMWWVRRRSNLQGDHRDNAQAALKACNVLLQLIGCIQQHRGMSTAFIAGDKGFQQRLVSKRSEIDPLIAQLQQVAVIENAYDYPCFTPNDITLWRHRWGVLTAELADYTVEKSIATHSNLIASLLNWLDAIGEARIELPMGDVMAEGAVRNFAHRLPQLTECLGQARATGSGVAAQSSCSAVARVRLMFLVSRAESLIDQACAFDKQGSYAALKVKALASMIRSQMLASQHVNVSAEYYFSEATAAIDAVFQWARDCGQNLERQLAQEARTHKAGRSIARQTPSAGN
ncbi:MAG: nitrate- and nitrite sensing domain-containing protein [Rhodocyclaceae bacterium]|nr:nitrate- and nitrite sensing domain-containing protein [Rhodocyclaceae bacterium]